MIAERLGDITAGDEVGDRILLDGIRIEDVQDPWAGALDQATDKEGASSTVSSAPTSGPGNIGTVPPASNRATAGWVMPARRASSG